MLDVKEFTNDLSDEDAEDLFEFLNNHPDAKDLIMDAIEITHPEIELTEVFYARDI